VLVHAAQVFSLLLLPPRRTHMHVSHADATEVRPVVEPTREGVCGRPVGGPRVHEELRGLPDPFIVDAPHKCLVSISKYPIQCCADTCSFEAILSRVSVGSPNSSEIQPAGTEE